MSGRGDAGRRRSAGRPPPARSRTSAPLPDPAARESDLCWKVARCIEREHKGYRRALRWLQLAERELPPGTGEPASRLQVTRGVIHFRLGRLQQSMACCELGLALARRDGGEGAQAYALAMLANPLVGLGLFDRAIEATREAVILYERIGDLAGQASGHGNLAACYQFVGDLPSSLHHHDISLGLNQRLSYQTGESIVHNNIAEVLLQLGQTETAIEHLRQVVDRWEERKTPPALVGFALVNLSRALLRGQDLVEAEEALAEGGRILTQIHAEGLLMEADLQLGRLLMARGRNEETRALCRKLLDTARSTGARLTEAQALCLAGTAASAVEDRTAAETLLRESAKLSVELGADYERGVALFALAGLLAGAREPSGQSFQEPLAEAIDLFRRSEPSTTSGRPATFATAADLLVRTLDSALVDVDPRVVRRVRAGERIRQREGLPGRQIRDPHRTPACIQVVHAHLQVEPRGLDQRKWVGSDLAFRDHHPHGLPLPVFHVDGEHIGAAPVVGEDAVGHEDIVAVGHEGLAHARSLVLLVLVVVRDGSYPEHPVALLRPDILLCLLAKVDDVGVDDTHEARHRLIHFPAVEVRLEAGVLRSAGWGKAQ